MLAMLRVAVPLRSVCMHGREAGVGEGRDGGWPSWPSSRLCEAAVRNSLAAAASRASGGAVAGLPLRRLARHACTRRAAATVPRRSTACPSRARPSVALQKNPAGHALVSCHTADLRRSTAIPPPCKLPRPRPMRAS